MSLEAAARVVALEADYAVVELQARETGCGRCHEPGGCGGTLLSQMKPPEKGRYRVLNSIGAALDEQVMLTIPDGSLLRASLWAYCLPLAGVLAGAGLGTWLLASEDAIVSLAVVGLLLGMVGLKWFERARRGQDLIRMCRMNEVCQHSEGNRT